MRDDPSAPLDSLLHATAEGNPSDSSMNKLVGGVHKFQKEIFGQQKELFERLATRQEPDTLFITCSDSRINPALLTQSEPGDIFILRNAGNIVPPYGAAPASGEAATIEFAVAALGVKDIIVCGHSHCGAMKALMDPSVASELPSMQRWLQHAEITRVIVREKYQDRQPEHLVNVCIMENVLAQLENLRTHPSVAAKLATGSVRLHAWVYKLETGEVFNYEPEAGQFVPVSNPDRTALPARHRERLGT